MKDYTLFISTDRKIRISVEYSGGELCLWFPYNVDAIADVKNIKGRFWHSKEKCWTVPKYEKLRACKVLDKHFGTNFTQTYHNQVERGGAQDMDDKLALIDSNMEKLYKIVENQLNDTGPIDWDLDTGKINYVYFIECAVGNERHIKIGYSYDPIGRKSKLSTGSSTELNLLFVIKGGKREEQLIHDLFASFRLKGEWFEETEQFIYYANRIKDNFGVEPPTKLDIKLQENYYIKEILPQLEAQDKPYEERREVFRNNLISKANDIPLEKIFELYGVQLNAYDENTTCKACDFVAKMDHCSKYDAAIKILGLFGNDKIEWQE